MVAKRLLRRPFCRLLGDRRGTAEVIGTVMFLLILLFFFTNVYMWHDSATREMNVVVSEKMSSQISLDWVSTTDHDGLLNVTNRGGSEVALSRLWIINNAEHIPFDLEAGNVWVAAGDTVTIEVGTAIGSAGDYKINYDPALAESFKILTVLGNTASCGYVPLLKGFLTVVEVARPDSSLELFRFSGNGTIGNFDLQSYGNTTQTFTLRPGTYEITQIPNDGWNLTGIFGDLSALPENGKATVSIVGGKSYEVRFLNTPLPD